MTENQMQQQKGANVVLGVVVIAAFAKQLYSLLLPYVCNDLALVVRVVSCVFLFVAVDLWVSLY